MCKTAAEMDVRDPSGDALAQPTRARLFALLVELRRPAETGELAERLGLHPNGVRRHLERLREAGLVERERAPGGPGRPPDRWLVDPAAAPAGERPAGYADLAVWLARAIPARPGRLRELERTGREIGRELAPPAAGDPLGAFGATLAALGFQPDSRVDADGRLCCRLGNCPYRDSVRANADAVCCLHRGITAGLLEEIEPAARLTRFEPADPDRAGCLIEAEGGAWETAGR
jgi:predicted ArsR family transcriptional regulator